MLLTPTCACVEMRQVTRFVAPEAKRVNMVPYDPAALTGAQLRAARALLGLSAQKLADLSGLGLATISRAEQLDGVVTMISANAERVVRALENAGVEFLGENGGGPGVRRRGRT